MSTTNVSANSYRHYNLPIVHPYIAFFGDNWAISRNAHAPQHFHNCVELGYCKTGSGTLFVEDKAFAFQAGDFSIIPENLAHKSQAATVESKWEYIYFDPYLILQDTLSANALTKLLAGLPTHFGVITENRDLELHVLMQQVFTELHNKDMYYQDSLKGLFLSLIMLLVRNDGLHHSVNSDFQWLYSAISHIRTNYPNKLSVAGLAKDCCGMSESHFRKKFHETMHISPLDYINHLRIRIACQAVYKNEKPINEIARDVGFPTLSSFNRNFHALLGCSPSEWRKLQLQENNIIEIRTLDEETVQGVFVL